MTEKEDMVNRPSHYNYGAIECIDAIRAMLGEEGFVAYCKGNALKYTWRAGLKSNTTEDLKKAAWYNRMAAGDDPRKQVGIIMKATTRPTFRIEDEDGPVTGNNYAYWSEAARLAGWTPPEEVDE